MKKILMMLLIIVISSCTNKKDSELFPLLLEEVQNSTSSSNANTPQWRVYAGDTLLGNYVMMKYAATYFLSSKGYMSSVYSEEGVGTIVGDRIMDNTLYYLTNNCTGTAYVDFIYAGVVAYLLNNPPPASQPALYYTSFSIQTKTIYSKKNGGCIVSTETRRVVSATPNDPNITGVPNSATGTISIVYK